MPTDSIPPIDEEDPDVGTERARVLESVSNDAIRLENLTKIYMTPYLGKHLAVHRLCLGVPRGEVGGTSRAE